MVRDKCQKCAGGSSGNACMGDSGGPLVLQVKDKMPLLVGIVSFGTFECGSFSTPSVFSDVSCYLDWILETVKV
jgi:secreted trypsin-like serine protease